MNLDRIVTSGGSNGIAVIGGALTMTANTAQGASLVGVLVSRGSADLPTATITASTLTRNQFGLRVSGDATALVQSSTISGNRTTAPGAGVLSGGEVNIHSSTITGNIADTDDTGNQGGGVAAEAAGRISLTNIRAYP